MWRHRRWNQTPDWPIMEPDSWLANHGTRLLIGQSWCIHFSGSMLAANYRHPIRLLWHHQVFLCFSQNLNLFSGGDPFQMISVETTYQIDLFVNKHYYMIPKNKFSQNIDETDLDLVCYIYVYNSYDIQIFYVPQNTKVPTNEWSKWIWWSLNSGMLYQN